MSEHDQSASPHAESEVPRNGNQLAGKELVAELKRRLEETRLPASLKSQILANLPPPEERERLFRELQESGGLTSEDFFASLGIKVNNCREPAE